MSKELEDYKVDNQRFMQDMNNKITTGKAEHIELSNEVSIFDGNIFSFEFWGSFLHEPGSDTTI